MAFHSLWCFCLLVKYRHCISKELDGLLGISHLALLISLSDALGYRITILNNPNMTVSFSISVKNVGLPPDVYWQDKVECKCLSLTSIAGDIFRVLAVTPDRASCINMQPSRILYKLTLVIVVLLHIVGKAREWVWQ